jgi:hypothetical protein
MRSNLPQASMWRFLLATGLRISEGYNGHRDGDHWIVPKEHSKTGVPVPAENLIGALTDSYAR